MKASVSIYLPLLACLLYAGSAGAEDRNLVRITGEIVTEGGSRTDATEVVLMSMNGQTMPERAVITLGGRFEFDSIEPGEYRLEVIDRRGNTLHEEYIAAYDGDNRVDVRLPPEQRQQSASGVVSVPELMAKIPPRALKEAKKAQDAAGKGDLEAAVRHAQRAISLYPAFPAAHVNLGVYYSRMKQPDLAIEEFTIAQRLLPHSAVVNSNLSVLLLARKEFLAAENAARRALRVEPGRPLARFVLGLCLKAQHRNYEEALANLQRAAQDIPDAHLEAADLLAARGDRTRAASELESYLGSAHPVRDRDEIETWLARLRAQ